MTIRFINTVKVLYKSRNEEEKEEKTPVPT